MCKIKQILIYDQSNVEPSAGLARLARLAGGGESADFLISDSLVYQPTALTPTSIRSGNLEISKRFKGKPPRNWKNKMKTCLSLCTLSQTNAAFSMLCLKESINAKPNLP